MFRRLFPFLTVVLLVACIVTSVAGYMLPRRSFPQTKGEIQLPGLSAPVEVIRDSYGIPHMYASNQHDLFFAQGYVQAQDRFWQMDVWRHIGAGRLSEMFGEKSIEQDRFLRTLQLERIVQQEMAMASEEELSILQDFAAGVNAYLSQHNEAGLSLEYAVLGVINAAYQPEPWEPKHSLTWAKMMAYDLGGNMDYEIQRYLLLETLTPEQVDELFLPYPDDHPLILPDFEARQRGYQGETGRQAALGDLAPALHGLTGRLEQVDRIFGLSGSFEEIGSNNWVIGGSRTATGKPILANDPHLGVQMPSIWYEVGLHCTMVSPDCPINVTGFSFSSSPGVIIGHNNHIAWGVTNVSPDVQDLYIEKINPENPNQYEYQGEWVDMEVYEEVLSMAGGEPETLTVRKTIHGPLITDVYGNLEMVSARSAAEQAGVYAIALRWTALEPTSVFRAIFNINQAQNWDEFRDALRDFSVPSQNYVFADVEGNIGYQTPGNIPVRRNGDGRMPAPGWTDEFEWEGYIPFDELPYSFNPERDYIVTANNAVAGPDYPYLIGTNFDPGFRAKRIVELVENAPGPIDIEYVKRMHGDNKNLIAEELVPIVLNLPLESERLEQARVLLADWDYQMRMDSSAAALFAAFWKHLMAETFHDQLPEDYWPTGNSGYFEIVRRLVQQPENAWWDDRATSSVETRDEILDRAFEAAVLELEDRLDQNPEDWSWGDLHTVTFRSQTLGGVPVLGALFNRGPYRSGGGASIVNATGWSTVKGYEVRSLPSMRMIVDLDNFQNSLSINTTGQSGHAYHPHYADLADLWRTIRYHPMQWDRQAVEGSAEGILRLVP